MSRPKDGDIDIMTEVQKVGFTFEEFVKNREKWVGRDDEILTSADKGGSETNKKTRRHIYEIEGYRCKSIEEVERIAKSQGVPLKSLDYQAILVPNGAGKQDVLVKFISRAEMEKRKAWR